MKNRLKSATFFRWFVNNKLVIFLAVVLLIFLNVLVISKVDFIFKPLGQFIGIISIPVVLAGVFYYLLNPIVDFFERRKIPRIITIIVEFVVIVLLILWGLGVVIPSAETGIAKFAAAMPKYVDSLQSEINDILRNPRFVQIRPQVDKTMESLGNTLVSWSKGFSGSALDSITEIISKTTDILISLVISPFVLFYLLHDGKKLNGYVTQFLPDSWRADTSKVLHEISKQLSNYVRGQVMVGFSVGVMLAIALPLVGLKYGLVLAIFSGFCNLIPFLGFFIAFIPALLIALATGGPIMLIKVLIVYILEKLIEGHLISPLVLGKNLKIHPLTVIFVLLTGEKIFGMWGVLLGIPVYAAIKVILTHVFVWYRSISGLYVESKTVGRSQRSIKISQTDQSVEVTQTTEVTVEKTEPQGNKQNNQPQAEKEDSILPDASDENE